MLRYFLAASLFALSACVSTYGVDISQDKIDQIQVGKSMKPDLITIFGEPIAVMKNSDGSEVISWGQGRSGISGFGSKSISVVFDSDGHVKSYSVAGYGNLQQ